MIAVVLSAAACGAACLPQEPTARPLPSPAQLAWQEAEFGVLVSYELHTFAPGRYVQREARRTPIDDIDRFAPEQLDCEQWVLAAKAAGARFAILTASHESGFRLWGSDANPYSTRSLRWGDGRRDVVGEFHAACVEHGVLPGVYVGTRWNAQLGVHDFRVTDRSTVTQDEYNRLIELEVEELCTRYGDWFEIWFDGGAHGPRQGGPDVLSVVARHQPGALFYHSLDRADARWGGSESGTVPYPCWATFPFPVTGAGESARPQIAQNGFALLKHGDPDGAYWLPAMSDAPLRGNGGHEWFWEPGDERLLFPVDALVDMYCRSVGHNSTLILGITPDTRGLVPDADVARLAELGAALRARFATALAAAPSTIGDDPVELPLPAGAACAAIVLQEDIRHGERVRSYRLELRDGDAWRPLATGSCIGHKHIHRLEQPVPATALRLVVERATGTPHLRTFAAYGDRTGAGNAAAAATDDAVDDAVDDAFADRWQWVGTAVAEPGYHVWGCSPIDGPDGRVHLFAARWPVAAGFDPGWRTDSEIAHYVADRAEGPFRFVDVIVRGDGDGWDACGAHNPTIGEGGDGYVLHYIANAGRAGHPANQCIGALTAARLAGPWRPLGAQPVLAPLTDGFDAGSPNGVNNPAYLPRADGSALLYFKTTDTRPGRGRQAVMGVAVAAGPGAAWVTAPEPVTANESTIEDGYAFEWHGSIRLLTTDNHGIVEEGGGLLWTSRDGLAFDPTPRCGFHRMDHYLDGRPGGARTHYGRGWKFERPQLLLRDGQPAYLYVASGTALDGGDGTTSYVLRWRRP